MLMSYWPCANRGNHQLKILLKNIHVAGNHEFLRSKSKKIKNYILEKETPASLSALSQTSSICFFETVNRSVNMLMHVEVVGRLDELPMFATNEDLRCRLEDRGTILVPVINWKTLVRVIRRPCESTSMMSTSKIVF